MQSAAYDWDSLRPHDGPPQQFAEPRPETKGSKRSRQTYSKYQTAVLETVFQTSKYIVRSRRQQMSVELSLTERQIKIWFQNRRMKEKKCGVHCKESPPPLADDRGPAVGYADDYAELGRAAGYHATALGPEDAFADFCLNGPAARHRPPPQHHESAGGFAGYGDCDDGSGGYDATSQARHHLHEADPYAAAAKQHLHWGAPAPVAVTDYDQDFFADPDLDLFQRLPTGHHHHHHHHLHHRPLINSQVQDYCPPQLQATHGY